MYPLLLIALWFWKGPQLLHAGPSNGFDLSGALVPIEQIQHGGPPRDGIPALDAPHFVSAADAGFLADDDRVLGIDLHGEQKAYPVRILNYHEIVNDRFGSSHNNTPVLVSYCPLCGTGMAFLARRNGKAFTFGVSGLLYNSDVLLYDRQTESLWSQIRRQAISGPLKGERLQQLPMEHTTWADWRARYPETQVLSLDTGYRRDYSRSPYEGYETSPRLMFDVANRDGRFHPKEWVISVEINGVFKAYPFSRLAADKTELIDTVGGETIRLVYDVRRRSGRVYRGSKLLPSTMGFWFAWYAFHPQTLVFENR
ncbi:MAG TPA: DUF3179 domain-containing protein [Gammaproteobacteria bacterium]|nr:DUF3179 domain-containing protein [Gammaproteobacteria bacterium]